jgi:hypothetical protein
MGCYVCEWRQQHGALFWFSELTTKFASLPCNAEHEQQQQPTTATTTISLTPMTAFFGALAFTNKGDTSPLSGGEVHQHMLHSAPSYPPYSVRTLHSRGAQMTEASSRFQNLSVVGFRRRRLSLFPRLLNSSRVEKRMTRQNGKG